MLRTMLNCFQRWMNPTALGGTPLLTSEPAAPRGPVAAASEPAPPRIDREEMQRASKVIAHVSELTTAVADEVGQHQSQIRDINSELSAVAAGDAGAVTAVIGKLLTANQDLQTRLERAELKLQAHS